MYKPDIILRAWFPSFTEIPPKLREDRVGWVEMLSRDSSVTPVPFRFKVCKLDIPARAEISLTWNTNKQQDEETWQTRLLRQTVFGWNKLKCLRLLDAEKSQLWYAGGERSQGGFGHFCLVQAELRETGRSRLEVLNHPSICHFRLIQGQDTQALQAFKPE